MQATLIDSLDKHQGASTAVLTAALVVVTIYYAIQNRSMVHEMARTRALTILPRLGVEFHHIGPAVMEVSIRNVGPGPAMNIDVRLIFEPTDESAQPYERRYRQNVLVPGEQLIFMPPGELGGNLETLPSLYRAIRLTGTMTDASGQMIRVEEAYDDLAEWRTLLHEIHRQWAPPEPERRLAEAVSKKFEPLFKDLGRQLAALREPRR